MTEEPTTKKAQDMRHFMQVLVPHSRVITETDLRMKEHTVFVPMSSDARILCWCIMSIKGDELGLEEIQKSTGTSFAPACFRMPRVGFSEVGVAIDGDAASIWLAQQMFEDVAEGIIDFLEEHSPETPERILQKLRGVLEAADARVERSKSRVPAPEPVAVEIEKATTV